MTPRYLCPQSQKRQARRDTLRALLNVSGRLDVGASAAGTTPMAGLSANPPPGQGRGGYAPAAPAPNQDI